MKDSDTMRSGWKSFLPRSPDLAGAFAVLTVVAVTGIFAPWVAPYDPVEQSDAVAGRHLPPLSVRPAIRYSYQWELADRVERTPEGLLVERLGKTTERRGDEVLNLTPDGVADRRFFLLGSDRLSRDVFSRLVYGARVSLLVGFGATALALIIGISIGSLAALGPRWLDVVLMRLVDGIMVLPFLVLLIFLAATFPGSGLTTMVLLLGCTAWATIARLVRGELLSLRQRDFVLAVRGLGGGMPYIFWRHLLPNALPPLLVAATLRVASLILLEATLSFLGFGIQQPTPSWGNMIAESRHTMAVAWWAGLFPGLALVVTIIAIAIAADALRDRLDPRCDGP